MKPRIRQNRNSDPLGLAAYLTLLLSSCVRMAKRASENPCVIAVLFAVLCYGAQAFVNINLPIAAPVMWTLLMLGAAGCRGRETDAAHRA